MYVCITNSYGLKVLITKIKKIHKMKLKNKITKMVLLTGLVITTISATANTNSLSDPTSVETEKTIKDYFKFPQIIIPVNESQKVEVLFTTNKNGKVDLYLQKQRMKI